MPVIGWLGSGSPETYGEHVAAAPQTGPGGAIPVSPHHAIGAASIEHRTPEIAQRKKGSDRRLHR